MAVSWKLVASFVTCPRNSCDEMAMAEICDMSNASLPVYSKRALAAVRIAPSTVSGPFAAGGTATLITCFVTDLVVPVSPAPLNTT